MQWTKWEKKLKQLEKQHLKDVTNLTFLGHEWNVNCIIMLMLVNMTMGKYPTCV